MSGNAEEVKLAVFDMDGTVFESYYDWERIKVELGIRKNILQELFREGTVDLSRVRRLEEYEEMNTRRTRPRPGIRRLLTQLRDRGVPAALNTNNSRKNAEYLLSKFNLSFNEVITRENKLWKPAPDSFLYLGRIFKCHPGQMVSIGDSRYDILASRAAGIDRIFIIYSDQSKQLAQKYPYIRLFRDYTHLETHLI
jgi:HAD superfamily hydrolase (TIGR01509 family)